MRHLKKPWESHDYGAIEKGAPIIDPYLKNYVLPSIKSYEHVREHVFYY